MRSFFCGLVAGLPLWAGSGIDMRTYTLPPAVVYQPYSPPALAVIGGGRCVPNQVSVAVAAGELPPGLTLSAAGFFSGEPVREGVYRFTVRAANDCESMTREFVLRVDGPALLRLDPEGLSFCYRSGDPPPAAQVAQVSANWEGLAYRIEVEGAPWLAARPLRGRTPREGAALQHDRVEVTVNAVGLKPGEYKGWLRVEAWEADNSPRIPVTLRVTAPALVEIERPARRSSALQ